MSLKNIDELNVSLFTLFTDILKVGDLVQVDSQDDSELCRKDAITLHLTTDDILSADQQKRLIVDQAYIVNVLPDRGCITVVARKPAGIFYGIVSLISLGVGSYSITPVL